MPPSLAMTVCCKAAMLDALFDRPIFRSSDFIDRSRVNEPKFVFAHSWRWDDCEGSPRCEFRWKRSSCYNADMPSEPDRVSENPYEPPQVAKVLRRYRGPFLLLATAWTTLVIGISTVLIESQKHYEVIGVSMDVPGPDIHAEFGTATIPVVAFAFGFAVLVIGWVALWFVIRFRWGGQ